MNYIKLLRACKSGDPLVRRIIFKGNLSGKIRTASYNGVEHIVVPVVALVEGVIWPVNADAPEFVPARALAEAPAGWNGRPVVCDHPETSGENISANDPKTLEAEKFGEIFDTYYDKKRLLMDAWLSPVLAEKVGKKAQRIIERVQKHDDVEISVGCLITAIEEPGEFKGQKYQIVWDGIISDHLAMLSEGSRGACSIAMGCGAPRTARMKINVLSSNSEEVVLEERNMPAEKKDETSRTLRERLASLIRFGATGQTPAGMSDSELHRALDDALRALEPGYLGIDDVKQADGIVIYATAPEDKLQLFSRKYKVADDRTVTVGADKVEGQYVAEFVPLQERSPESKGKAAGDGCGCHKGVQMKTKAERIKALIDDKKTTLPETFLQTCTEDQLKALEEVAPPVAPKTEEKPATEAKPAPPKTEEKPTEEKPKQEEKQLTAAEQEAKWLKEAPAPVRSMFENYRASELVRRTTLVGRLKTAQKSYTEQELQNMPLVDLEKIAVLAGVESPTQQMDRVRDFSGLGMPRAASSNDDAPDPPERLTDRIRAAAAAAKK